MTTTHPGSLDPNAFLMGGGGKSAKFEKVGDIVAGTIAAVPELRQQTDIGTGKPRTWDNGDPVMQLVVKLQTEQREDAEDDGIRNLYVSGGFKRASLQKAVADAIRTAKASGLTVGGKLEVKFTGEEPASTRGYNPAKLYAARYTPPADSFLAEPTSGQATTRVAAQPADPWAATPTAPTAGGPAAPVSDEPPF